MQSLRAQYEQNLKGREKELTKSLTKFYVFHPHEVTFFFHSQCSEHITTTSIIFINILICK